MTHLNLIAKDLADAGYKVEVKENSVFASLVNRSVFSIEISTVLDAYVENELVSVSSVNGVAKVTCND